MPDSRRSFHFHGALALGLVVALVTAPPGRAQTRKDAPPPQPAPDLFQPVPTTTDLSPAQERALAEFRADPSAGAVQLFRVNLEVPKTADTMNLNILPGANLLLATRDRQDRAPNDYSWTGGDASGGKSAVLVVKGSSVTGTIRDGGRVFRVRPVGDGLTAVIEIAADKLPPEHPPAFDRRERERKVEPPPPPPPAAMRARVARADASSAAPAAVFAATSSRHPTGADAIDSDPCATIDVFVAYTPEAERETGGVEGFAQLAVDETNTSYANSGIRPRLRLAGLARVDYVESGDMEADLARLVDPHDGALDDVPGLRDRAGADLAVLLTGNGNFCGIAADILASPDRAYAVVGQNCATGYYSFGHELGHLQGARHNTEEDPSTTPFAYGHGFYSLVNRKRTVMSYNCPPGCTRIDVWADPAIVVDGVPMGDAAVHNDARVLNETACAVAAYRASSAGRSTGGGAGGSTPGTPHRAPALSAWSVALLLVAGSRRLLARRASR